MTLSPRAVYPAKSSRDTATSGRTRAAAARANHPIPLNSDGFYFEITILDSGETG